MARKDNTLDKVLRGLSDSNIAFTDLCQLLLSLGFEERIKGGHHIFSKDDVEEIINIQPLSSKAKSYQVKQIRNIIIKYKLAAGDDE
jgi:predicted RNA binding protein YcfA (HicA-like mRNA interferase family)